MAGFPLSNHLLKHSPALVGLRVVLLSPNDEMLWPYAIVRAVVPSLLDDNKISLPLEPEANRVVVSTNAADQRQQIIEYNALVIATGSSCKDDMPFKNLSNTESTKQGMQSLRERIATARSLVVAGAGLTGVELAGELGQEYGPSASKDTVVGELTQLKLKVMTNTRVVDVSTAPAGKQSLVLQRTDKVTDNAATIRTPKADLYIPAFSVRPNITFVPEEMLDFDGRVKIDRTTLQATRYANIFAFGDAANAQTATSKHADAQADDTFVFAVTMGPNRGTGQLGSWRLWAWIIRGTIAKHLGTDYAPEIVAGNRTITQTRW
uniref:FAD/NAD(P)-binding domain-containing protein n=1 Tax=Bionectria ochroleuca TaxID=29856 RepID=A0A8H7N5E3_BIOOC